MCGRFALGKPTEEINEELEVGDDGLEEYLPNFNVAPTQITPVLLGTEKRKITAMRWGLIPFWAKDRAIGSRMINARLETLAEKPSFRNLVARRHCAVIMQGYYEWQRNGNRKIPHFIRSQTGKLSLMAGLWDVWKSPDAGQVTTFTIITTNATPNLSQIHDRMPVALPPESVDRWLRTSELSVEQALSILAGSGDYMEAYPVSTVVNSARNNSPQCIEPWPQI